MNAILVVDDQPANREFLGSLLGYKGYGVIEAVDGEEALAKVRKSRPALVICDILMPTMDGFEFVRQLRMDPELSGIPVVFCTAHYLEREAIGLASRCGVNHVLTKPIEPQRVLEVVESILRQPPAQPAHLERPDAFQQEHLQLITDKLSRTTGDLRSAHERLAALVELNLRLASERNPQRLLEQVCLGARQLLGARYSALGILNRENGQTTRLVVSGLAAATTDAFGTPKIDKGILGGVMTGGRSYRLAGKTIGATAAGLPEGFPTATSILASPVASPTGTFGWLCLTDKLYGGEFSEDDEKLLDILAAQTGRIYENGSLYRKVQAHAAEMEIEIAERIRAEHGLRETEQRFRQLAENIQEVFWLSDPAHQEILYVSPAYEEVWGRSCESLYLSPGDRMDAIHPDDRMRVLAAARNEQARGSYNEEYRIVRPDGSIRWIRDQAFPVFDKSGQIYRVAGVANDVTVQLAIERENRETKNFLASIFDNIPNSIFIKDARDLRFVRVNAANGRLTGYSSQELIGKSDHDLFPGPQADFFVAKDRETLAGKQQVVIVEEEITGKDGVTRTLRTKKFPMLGEDGRAQYLLGMSEDITERKLAERRLKESESRFRQLIEQASDGIFVIDAAGNFVLVNSRCCELLGYVEDELLGVHHEITYPAADRTAMEVRIRRAVQGEIQRYERMVRRKDGSTFPAAFSSRMLPAGEIQVIFEDITDRRRAEQQLRESENKFRQLIEQASDGIFISDAEGRFVMVNTRGCELLGYAPEEMIGLSGKVTYVEEEAGVHAQRMAAVAAGQDLRYERLIKRKDGSTFPAEISLKMLENGLVQVIFHDITARKDQERRIARLSRIQAVLSGINSAIVRIRDRQELLNEACRIATKQGGFPIAWIALLDVQTGKLEPKAFSGFDPGFFDSLREHVSRGGAALASGGVGMQAMEGRRTVFDNDIMMNADLDFIRREAVDHGCRSVIGLPLFGNGEIVGAFMLYANETQFFDEGEVKLLEELANDVSFALTFIAQQEQVEYLAYYDTLTGLPNRSLFFDRLAHQLGTAGRDGDNVALFLMDMDRFRLINDTLGRQAGDNLIRAVALRMKSGVRDADTVARIGADSFAFAISGKWNASSVAHILESHNRQFFGTAYLLGQEELRVSATAGIAVSPGDGNNPEALFANAEAALRLAKAQSVAYLFYGPEMNARVAESLRMETRLRRAIEGRELVLWYQPKVDLKTGRITGFEALMRWQDPESGMVPPGKFIPLMEQTGMILDAGNWALSQVAVDCRTWTANGACPPRIAVNVSPIQLRQKDFVAKVIAAADETQAGGGFLDLEITESVIMENVDSIIPKLQTIRGLGTEIYIDDFGTGYSSLAYIARLPIHSLKIDRSFIIGITQNEESLNIVNSVISLAHSLKMRVVAEGVETEAQAALLRQLKCDEMQGYLYSRPVPPDQVPALLANSK